MFRKRAETSIKSYFYLQNHKGKSSSKESFLKTQISPTGEGQIFLINELNKFQYNILKKQL